MAVSRDRFREELRNSGAVSYDALEQLLREYPDEAAMPTPRFAQELVRRELLTSYQAKQLCEGESIALGDYVILSPLGEGGMGKVFCAKHGPMGRLVALKVIRDKHLDSRAAVERFEREVRAAARLTHPNIVRAYDAGIRQGRHFLAMELIDGLTLTDLVKSEGALSVARAAACIVQAAEGLACAHKHGIIHRDVKPRNLILDSAGTVKILDLGVARLLTDQLTAEDSVTLTGELLGTFDYMAPEQALDAKAVDHRSDIYSLGCTLYFLLTGKTIFGGASALAKARAHREEPAPSLCRVRDDVPPALDTVFQTMVAKDPNARFATMADVIRSLAPFAAEATVLGPTRSRSSQGAALKETVVSDAASRGSQVIEPRSAGRGVVVGVVILAVLAAIVAGAVYFKNRAGVAEANSSGESVAPDSANLEAPVALEVLRFVVEKKRAAGAGPQSQPVALVRAEQPDSSSELIEIRASLDDLAALEDRAASAVLQIERIDLGETDVQDHELQRLAGLAHLVRLSLYSCNQITDSGLEQLAGMTSLEQLDLRQTKVTPRGLELLSAYPLSEVLLDGYHGVMTKEAAAVLAADHERTMTVLVLQGVALDETAVRSLGRMTRLRTLDLTGAGIRSEWLKHLESLTALVELVLDRNPRIDDGALEHLRKLPSLASVSVIGASIAQPEKFEESLNARVRFQ